MDYFSCSKKKKDKKTRFLSKLFRKRSKKENVKDKDEVGANDCKESREGLDEDAWNRMKAMEQKREISALKNHIEKLEVEINNSKGERENESFNTKEGFVCEDSAKENAVNKVSLLGEKEPCSTSAESVVDKESKDKMLKNILNNFKKPSRKLSDSSTETFVYLDLETEAKNGTLADENQSKCQAEVGGEKVRKISKRYFKRRSGDDFNINENEETIEDGDKNDKIIEENVQQGIREMVSREHAVDETEGSNNLDEQNEPEGVDDFEKENDEDFMKDGDVKLSVEISEDLETHKDIVRKEGVFYTEEEKTFVGKGQDDVGQSMNLISNEEKMNELASVNEELKKKVAELEEDIWLANEDRVNMQAMLERQKDKAIRNLALKFEDINKKTLCEFKGIFERKLLEVNEEKFELQQKLEIAEQNKKICCDDVGLIEKYECSEKKIKNLEDENVTLKQRCRKMSANLGQLKKQTDIERKNHCMFDVMTQTDDIEDDKAEMKNLIVQFDDSFQSSLKNIHHDVKYIADSVNSLSENLMNSPITSPRDSPKKLGDTVNRSNRTETFDANQQVASFQKVSPNINSESDEESFRLRSPIPHSDSLCESLDSAFPKTEISYKEENFQLLPSNTEILNGEIVKNLQGSDERSIDFVDANEVASDNECDKRVDTDIVCEDKTANSASEDGDSGVFGSEFTQIIDDDIESKLHRIEDKYRKIAEQIENYENSKTGEIGLSIGTTNDFPTITEINKEEKNIKSMEFDPEIKKIIDDVNKKYKAYFFANKS